MTRIGTTRANAEIEKDIFDLRGIDRDKGALIVVRPDQYVSNVLPLEAHDEPARFFSRFMVACR